MRSRIVQKSVAPVVLGACVWMVMPAQAFAKAVVRFVHAVPGVGRADVSVNDGSGNKSVGSIGFGQATGFKTIRSGAFHWSLSGGGKTLATGTTTVGNGAYDLVVLEQNSKVKIGVYRAQAGKPGTALVRVIHAAPEFGTPQLMVDGKVAVKSLAYTKDTPYVALPAGSHALAAEKQGGSSPLISANLPVTDGKSYSVVVIGTRGQMVRVVPLVDRGLTAAHAAPVSDDSTSSPNASTVVVKSGDSLWSIARSLAGPRASDEAVEQKLVSLWKRTPARSGPGTRTSSSREPVSRCDA